MADEHRVVALAEARSGVRLPADREVVLTVKDLGTAPEAERGESRSAKPGKGSAPADPAGRADPEQTAETERAAEAQPNFHVQLELPDGSDYARNKPCMLEIPGHPPVEGTTNDAGELVLSTPNVSTDNATLRLFDGGGVEIASWPVTLRADDDPGADPGERT